MEGGTIVLAMAKTQLVVLVPLMACISTPPASLILGKITT
jgi:hypothetical protein